MAAKTPKVVKPDNRAILFGAFGQAAAQALGVETYHIKAPGVTECIVVEVEGQQFVGNVTFKAKKPIEWDSETDVKATFTPDGEIITPPAAEAD